MTCCAGHRIVRPMVEELRNRADARLEAALERHGLADPRQAYRDRLRTLREANPELFERARQHYDEVVLPALAGEGDPIGDWIEYGSFLGELAAHGRLFEIDATGRAEPYSGAYRPTTMVLHIPDDARSAVLAAAVPGDPSAAQRATRRLLIEGRQEL